MATRGLYIFTHDCRLHDNPALLRLSQHCDELLCVYILDIEHINNTNYERHGIGEYRKNFIHESLLDLRHKLEGLNQDLLVLLGTPCELVSALHLHFSFDVIGISQHPGVYEKELIKHLETLDTRLMTHDAFTLLSSTDLILDLESKHKSFTPFRKLVEAFLSEQPITTAETIKHLPPPPKYPDELSSIDISISALTDNGFKGGETAALTQLKHYCQPGLLDQYKNTRNDLVGWNFSSKLSPWLANGSLSAKTVWQNIEMFEQNHGSNESTYWLKFELLWREYFQCLLNTHQSRFFQFKGLSNQAPNSTFDRSRYQAWVNGETGYSGVDAAMKQLQQTGWLSNRARQWVASCFVHELNLDWRYGAAYFEQELIDYDVANNWGNWLYLAGVGTDPRGHRKFNLSKQLETYDPKQLFIKTYS